MNPSLKDIIYHYVKSSYPRIVHKGELGKLAVNEWGFENENMGRRCRDLEIAGKIEKIPDQKGRAQYRWIPVEAKLF